MMNLLIFGKVFSYGSSCSMCKSCIPPICKVGSIATASTIIPIPPNHCNNDRQTSIPSDKISKFGINIAKDGISRSADQILSQKGVNMKKIREIWPEIHYFSKEIDNQLEINSHYRGYLKKQNADILAFKKDENLVIPEKIDYDAFSGLSNEVKSKFKKIRPKTMGQALRIDGITPAAVYILLSHLKRRSIKHIA